MQEWRCIGPDRAIAKWAAAALPHAVAALRQTERRAGGTWAVGLDLLDNDATGAVGGVPLPWAALGLAAEPLHRAQLSTVFPGYPRPDADEPESANRYRLLRDAAHLDGVLAIGADRQRKVKEPHGWILGLPLTDCTAAPLVVWEGSVAVIRAALRAALAGHPTACWDEVDVTAAYVAARREVFQTCRRVELPVVRGQATLLHRLCLHGVAPWPEGTIAPSEGRIIAYFRPLLPSVAAWLADG